MKKRRRRPGRHSEFLKAALIVVVIGLALRLFVVLPHRVGDHDMENSLFEGDFLLVSQLAYKFHQPAAGDLVVYKHPFKSGEAKAGRIIATEGQTVEIAGKAVHVNGAPLVESDNVKHVDVSIIPAIYSNRDFSQPVSVPAGVVYVLSDNRDAGTDSRDLGLIDIENIKGKALFVYWSWRADPNAPKWESPYVIPAIQILLYNLVHFPSRTDWGRVGASVN